MKHQCIMSIIFLSIPLSRMKTTYSILATREDTRGDSKRCPKDVIQRGNNTFPFTLMGTSHFRIILTNLKHFVNWTVLPDRVVILQWIAVTGNSGSFQVQEHAFSFVSFFSYPESTFLAWWKEHSLNHLKTCSDSSRDNFQFSMTGS